MCTVRQWHIEWGVVIIKGIVTYACVCGGASSPVSSSSSSLLPKHMPGSISQASHAQLSGPVCPVTQRPAHWHCHAGFVVRSVMLHKVTSSISVPIAYTAMTRLTKHPKCPVCISPHPPHVASTASPTCFKWLLIPYEKKVSIIQSLFSYYFGFYP